MVSGYYLVHSAKYGIPEHVIKSEFQLKITIANASLQKIRACYMILLRILHMILLPILHMHSVTSPRENQILLATRTVRVGGVGGTLT